MKELTNCRILLTRPESQSLVLAEKIRDYGGIPIVIPLLETKPLADNAHLAEICQNLEQYQLAFFVSPAAIEISLNFILNRRVWPQHLQVSCVGQASAESLFHFGFTDVLYPKFESDSEAVLALEAFSAEKLKGAKIILFRAQSGRDFLQEELQKRGAKVDVVMSYQRHMVELDAQQLAILKQPVDCLQLTSTQALRSLNDQMGEDVAFHPLLQRQVFGYHAKISQLAKQLGFKHVSQSQASDSAFLQSVIQWWKHSCA